MRNTEEQAVALFYYHRRYLLLSLSAILSNRGEFNELNAAEEAFIVCTNRLMLQTEASGNPEGLHLNLFQGIHDLSKRVDMTYLGLTQAAQLGIESGVMGARRDGGVQLQPRDRIQYLTSVFSCTDLQLLAQALFSLYDKTGIDYGELELQKFSDCIRGCEKRIWESEAHDDKNPFFYVLACILMALLTGIEYRLGKYQRLVDQIKFVRESPLVAKNFLENVLADVAHRSQHRGSSWKHLMRESRPWKILIGESNSWKMKGVQGVVAWIAAFFFHGIRRPPRDVDIEHLGLQDESYLFSDVPLENVDMYTEQGCADIVHYATSAVDLLLNDALKCRALTFLSRLICSKSFACSTFASKWVELLHDSLVEMIHFERLVVNKNHPVLFETQAELEQNNERLRKANQPVRAARDCMEEVLTLQIQLIRFRPLLATEYFSERGPLVSPDPYKYKDADGVHINGKVLFTDTKYVGYLCHRYADSLGTQYRLVTKVVDLLTILSQGGFVDYYDPENDHNNELGDYHCATFMSDFVKESYGRHVPTLGSCPPVLTIANLVAILRQKAQKVNYDLQEVDAINKLEELKYKDAPPAKISKAAQHLNAVMNKDPRELKTLDEDESSLVESILRLLQAFARYSQLLPMLLGCINEDLEDTLVGILVDLLVESIPINLKGEILYTLSLLARNKTCALAIFKGVQERNLVPSRQNRSGLRKEITSVEPSEHNYSVSVGLTCLFRSLLYGRLNDSTFDKEEYEVCSSSIQFIVDEVILKAFKRPVDSGYIGSVTPWKIAGNGLAFVHDVIRSYQPFIPVDETVTGSNEYGSERPFAFSRNNPGYILTRRILGGGDLFDFLLFVLSVDDGAAGLKDRRRGHMLPGWEQHIERILNESGESSIDSAEQEFDAFDAAIYGQRITSGHINGSTTSNFEQVEAQESSKVVNKVDLFLRGGSVSTGDGKWPKLAKEKTPSAYSDDECWWRERCAILSLSIMEALSFIDTNFVAGMRGLDINDSDIGNGSFPTGVWSLLLRFRALPMIMQYVAYPRIFDSRVSLISARLLHRLFVNSSVSISLQEVWSQLESSGNGDTRPLCSTVWGEVGTSSSKFDRRVRSSMTPIIPGIANKIYIGDHSHSMQDVVLSALCERMRNAGIRCSVTQAEASGQDSELNGIRNGEGQLKLNDEELDRIWQGGYDTGSGEGGVIAGCGNIDFGVGLNMSQCQERTGQLECHCIDPLTKDELTDLIQSASKYCHFGFSSRNFFTSVPKISITLATRAVRETVLLFLSSFVELSKSIHSRSSSVNLADFLFGFSKLLKEQTHSNSCLYRVVKLLDSENFSILRPAAMESAVSILVGLCKWSETSSTVLRFLWHHANRKASGDILRGRFFFLDLFCRIPISLRQPVVQMLSDCDDADVCEKIENEPRSKADVSGMAYRESCFHNVIAAVLQGFAIELQTSSLAKEWEIHDTLLRESLHALGRQESTLHVLFNLVKMKSLCIVPHLRPSTAEIKQTLAKYNDLLAEHPEIGYSIDEDGRGHIYELRVVKYLVENRQSVRDIEEWVRSFNDDTIRVHSSSNCLKRWWEAIGCLFNSFVTATRWLGTRQISRQTQVLPATELMLQTLSLIQNHKIMATPLLEQLADAIMLSSRYIRDISSFYLHEAYRHSSTSKSLMIPPFSKEKCYYLLNQLVYEIKRASSANLTKQAVKAPFGGDQIMEKNSDQGMILQFQSVSPKYRAKVYIAITNILEVCLGNTCTSAPRRVTGHHQNVDTIVYENADAGEESLYPFALNLADSANEMLMNGHEGVGLDSSANLDTLMTHHPFYGDFSESVDEAVTSVLPVIQDYREMTLATLEAGKESLVQQLINDVSQNSPVWRLVALQLLIVVLREEKHLSKAVALSTLCHYENLNIFFESLAHLDALEGDETQQNSNEDSIDRTTLGECIDSILGVLLLCGQSSDSCSAMLSWNLMSTLGAMGFLGRASHELSSVVDELVPARSSAFIAERLFPRISNVLNIILSALHLRPVDNRLTEQVHAFVRNHTELLTALLHVATFPQTSVCSLKLASVATELISMALSRDTSRVDSSVLIDESVFRPHILTLFRKYVSQAKAAPYAFDDFPIDHLPGKPLAPSVPAETFGTSQRGILNESSQQEQTRVLKRRSFVYQSGGIGRWNSEKTNELAGWYGETWWYAVKPMTNHEASLSCQYLRFATFGGLMQTQYSATIVQCAEQLFARIILYIRVVSSEKNSNESPLGLSTTLVEPMFIRKEEGISESSRLTPHGYLSLEVLARTVQQLGASVTRVTRSLAQLEIVSRVLSSTEDEKQIRQMLYGNATTNIESLGIADSVHVCMARQFENIAGNPKNRVNELRCSAARSQLRLLSSLGTLKFALENAVWMWYLHAQHVPSTRPSADYVRHLQQSNMPSIEEASPFTSKVLRFLARLSNE